MNDLASVSRSLMLGFSDLEFARVQTPRHSSCGTPYIALEAAGMPRVPPKVLDCAFYLYHSVEDAKAGKQFGGTGFLVFVPSRDGTEDADERGWFYAVTNWHVAVRDGASVVRVNTIGGATDIFDFGPEQWEFDPKLDIAVIPINLTNTHKFSLISTRIFCSPMVAANQQIGPGDDVFMAGRFVDHDGSQTNQPSLRFGHISVSPTPMKQSNGHLANCYCVDIHSRTGYSGSPVFVYRTPGNTFDDIADDKPRKMGLVTSGTRYFGLLGIHFAQFPEMWEIERASKMTADSDQESLISGRSAEYIRGMSGMTCVLPAWSIVEVLNMPKVKQGRGGRHIVLNMGHHMNQLPVQTTSTPSDESAAPPTTDENPTHREDFNSLLGAAARKPKQDDRT